MPTWIAAGRCMSSAGRLKKLKYAWKKLGLETGSLLSPTDQGVRNPSLNCSHVEICHIIYWHFFNVTLAIGFLYSHIPFTW